MDTVPGHPAGQRIVTHKVPARQSVDFRHAQTAPPAVRCLGCRTEPAIIVQPLRYRLFSMMAGGATGGRPDHDLLEFANVSVSHQLTGVTRGIHGSQLGAVLKHGRIAFHRLGQGTALGNGVAQRLFTVHVLSGFDRGDRLEYVPVIRCGDQHGINVLTGQQVLKVIVAARGRDAGDLGRSIAITFVHIAYGHHLCARGHEVSHAAGPLAARANHTQSDSIGGCIRSKHGTRHNGGQRHGRPHALKYLTSGYGPGSC